MTGKGAVMTATEGRKSAMPGHRPVRSAEPIESPPTCTLEVEVQLEPAPLSVRDRVAMLEPGATHELRVGLRPANGGSRSFAAKGDLVLDIEWADDCGNDGFVRVIGDPILVPIAKIGHEHSLGGAFTVVVDEVSLRMTRKLCVTAVDRKTNQQHRIYELTLEVDGDLLAPPADMSRAVAINFGREPDPRLAVIHVYTEGGTTFVRGYHPSALLTPVAIELPSFDLAASQAEDDDLTDNWYNEIIAHIADYSQSRLSDVHRWLNYVLPPSNEVCIQGNARFAIVIAEYIDSRVPWEMLVLKNGTVLGERAIVTRWATIQPHGEIFTLDPATAVQGEQIPTRESRSAGGHGSGGVLSYLDLDAADQGQLPKELERCRNDSCDDARALLNRIKLPIEGCALVMLACHGIFARKEDPDVEIGSLRNPSQRLQRIDLAGLAAPKGMRPLVFVNACHSARMKRSDRHVFGIPEAFLRVFARGYLGTVSAVEQTIAAEIAARIVAGACSPSGICLPELLFKMRRAAASTRDRDRRTFVETFMYVFYGSPGEWLTLEPKRQPGNAHG